MARKTKSKRKPVITLPPFTWPTEATLCDGTTAPMARAPVTRGDVDLPGVLIGTGKETEVITGRARVWRTRLPPIFRILNPAAKAAVLDYAEAVAAVGSSGGTSDPTGGGGGGARGPSLRALTAAENLRHMHQALDRHQMAVPVKDARRLRRGDGMVRVPYRQLADWVAVDELARDEILRRAGAAPSNEVAQDAATLAIADMAQCLAVCCGYVEDRAQ